MDGNEVRGDTVGIVVLMGVSGSGKTAVGKLLAQALEWPFYDGDDFQPKANLSKMAQGLALSDRDRDPWLRALRDLLRGILARRGKAVLACSLLKHAYREEVLGEHPAIRLVHLKGPFGLIEARLKQRQNHFFGADLLSSQFEILEAPENALTLQVDREPATIAADIRRVLGL